MDKQEKEKQRKQYIERSLKWKDDNFSFWTMIQIVKIICLTIGIIVFLVILFTPHPQHINFNMNCNTLYVNIYQKVNVLNCTISGNATVWISEQQLIENRTGLP